jgi:endo-1,4-beta-xylanase
MQNRRESLNIAGGAAAAICFPITIRAGIRSRGAGAARQTDISGSNSLGAQARGLLAGCAVVPQKFDSEPHYASTIAEQANILVAENAMKWAALRPAPDRFDFRAADELLAFTRAHGQKLRGHNLCWQQSIPAWFAGTVNTDNVRQFLTEHIQTVAGRYAGKIHSWDVVNEAIDVKSGRADGLRNKLWLELIGPGGTSNSLTRQRARPVLRRGLRTKTMASRLIRPSIRPSTSG